MQFSKLMRLEEGDLVYRTITAFEAPSAVVQSDFEGAFVTPQAFPVFRLNGSKILPAFMELLTTSPKFHEAMSERCTGTVLRRKTLAVGAFLSIPISLPSLEEQRRIVDLIGAVDGAIDAANTGVANSDALWWQLTSELQERASKTESTPFGSIAAISGGLTKNKKDFERPDVIDVPYLRVANVHRRYLDLSDVATIRATPEKLEALRLQPGDLLLNEGGDKDKLGRGAIWRGELQDCIHQNHVFRARITDASFVPEFVSAWANSFGKGWFETYGTQTTGIASISKTTLSKFPIPCLHFDDQQQWADLLDSAMVSQDSYRETADSLRSLRTELLASLLSGAHTIPETYDELMGA
jgi:type I restriction enzyme S subunit